MNSKRKRNTILAYCMATVIMLCVLASNIFEATTSLKTTKKVVAGNNYVETSEISYGLVAIEASSSIDEKNAQNVTEEKEEKKEESQKESEKTSENKSTSSTSNATKTATSNKTTSNKTTTSKTTTTTKKSNTTTTKKTTTVKSNTTTTKKSNSTTTKTTASTSNTSTTKTTNNSGLGTQIANYAKQFNGNPYVHGGTSLTKGADCSGFVQSVFKHFGISLPRTAKAQSQVGKKVDWNDLQPGDLIFYGNHSTTVSHVALYIGNGKIIHAQTPSLGIGISTYKIMTRVVARRVI